ncbi:class I adenylate-forming enzyme family protein [soil metagenome]
MLILHNSEAMPTQGQLLRAHARLHANRLFAVIDDEEVRYSEFGAQAEGLARGMLADGLKPGDHVGILMPNCIDFLLVYYAAQLVGAVAIPINARYKSAELAHAIRHADIRILFTTDRINDHVNFGDLLFETLPSLEAATHFGSLALGEAPALTTIVLFGAERAPFRTPAALVKAGLSVSSATLDEAVDHGGVDDIALILFTSGTTAMPKACRLSHRNLYQNWVIAYPQIVGLEVDQGIWCPLPCFHIGGVGLALAALSRGACFLSSIHHQPGKALDFIRRHRPHHLYPGFFTLLMPMLRDPGYNRSHLDSVVSIWMVAPFETHKQMREFYPAGIAVHQNFGMTEGAGMVTMTRPSMPEDERLLANGMALPGCEVRIADAESDGSLPDGQEGEIQFRGPNAFRDYYKDEPASRAARAPGGWVKTGDWGRLDDTGVLSFRGRMKDMLKVGGENVAAAEIEAFLGRHPAVNLAQVVARADDHYGEVPVAFVELREGTVADERELIEFCKARLASFKAPRQIVFVTEWPMSATKVQKFRLREMFSI